MSLVAAGAGYPAINVGLAGGIAPPVFGILQNVMKSSPTIANILNMVYTKASYQPTAARVGRPIVY